MRLLALELRTVLELSVVCSPPSLSWPTSTHEAAGRQGVILAAVGGINQLILARVERGEAQRLPQDADHAAAVVVGLLERR